VNYYSIPNYYFTENNILMRHDESGESHFCCLRF
jgi:hypothetical protein